MGLCSTIAELLGLGSIMEPLVHPKPGGVTRCRPWRGLTIFDFARASAALRAGLAAACERGCSQGCLAAAVRAYLGVKSRLGPEGNANLGTLLLLAPLACTAPAGGPVGHAMAASRCARSLGAEDAELYYRALEAVGPGHLGRYEGPVPAVGSGRYPRSMIEVLLAARWDHVHAELLNGYPLTLEAFEWLRERGDREDSLALLILTMIARHGDTLIGRKWGWAAAKKAMAEARLALRAAEREGLNGAIGALRRLWEERGWNPGAVLDIVAAGLGLYYLHG